jgi:hypothetical protein
VFLVFLFTAKLCCRKACPAPGCPTFFLEFDTFFRGGMWVAGVTRIAGRMREDGSPPPHALVQPSFVTHTACPWGHDPCSAVGAGANSRHSEVGLVDAGSGLWVSGTGPNTPTASHGVPVVAGEGGGPPPPPLPRTPPGGCGGGRSPWSRGGLGGGRPPGEG